MMGGKPRLRVNQKTAPKRDKEAAGLRSRIRSSERRIKVLTDRLIAVLESRPVRLDSGEMVEWSQGQHYWFSLENSDDTICLLCDEHWVDGVVDGGCKGP